MADPRQVVAALAARLGLQSEYQVAPAGRPPLWVAGLDLERAAVVEIVPVGEPSTWLLTPEIPRAAGLVDAAQTALDTRLLRLAEVLADPGSPMTRLLIYTDDDVATDVLADAVGRTGLARQATILVLGLDAGSRS